VSGWKARIGYLSPSVFETPSDWDLILPQGFTIVASGLSVQAHTESEFNKAIDALEAGLGIFTAEECDAILLGGITRLDTIQGALDEGFAFVQMGRSLLREPELLLAMRKDEAHESLCIHCNKCMPTIYRGTHCVFAEPQST